VTIKIHSLATASSSTCRGPRLARTIGTSAVCRAVGQLRRAVVGSAINLGSDRLTRILVSPRVGRGAESAACSSPAGDGRNSTPCPHGGGRHENPSETDVDLGGVKRPTWTTPEPCPPSRIRLTKGRPAAVDGDHRLPQADNGCIGTEWPSRKKQRDGLGARHGPRLPSPGAKFAYEFTTTRRAGYLLPALARRAPRWTVGRYGHGDHREPRRRKAIRPTIVVGARTTGSTARAPQRGQGLDNLKKTGHETMSMDGPMSSPTASASAARRHVTLPLLPDQGRTAQPDPQWWIYRAGATYSTGVIKRGRGHRVRVAGRDTDLRRHPQRGSRGVQAGGFGEPWHGSGSMPSSRGSSGR